MVRRVGGADLGVDGVVALLLPLGVFFCLGVLLALLAFCFLRLLGVCLAVSKPLKNELPSSQVWPLPLGT